MMPDRLLPAAKLAGAFAIALAIGSLNASATAAFFPAQPGQLNDQSSPLWLSSAVSLLVSGFLWRRILLPLPPLELGIGKQIDGYFARIICSRGLLLVCALNAGVGLLFLGHTLLGVLAGTPPEAPKIPAGSTASDLAVQFGMLSNTAAVTGFCLFARWQRSHSSTPTTSLPSEQPA
jgi:hypothetical protein